MRTKRRYSGLRAGVIILIVLFFTAGYSALVLADSSFTGSTLNAVEATEQIDTSYIMKDLIMMTIIITVLLIFLMLYKMFGTGNSKSETERIQAVAAVGQPVVKPNKNLLLATNMKMNQGMNNSHNLQFHNSNDNQNTEIKTFKCWRCNSPMERSDMCPYCGWAVKTSRPVGYWSLFR
jgi:hypothetical protein